MELDSAGEGLRRLKADGGSRSVVSAEEGLRDSSKWIWHRALCVVAGRCGYGFESSIEGVDMVRSNENDAFVVFQTFQNTKDDG